MSSTLDDMKSRFLAAYPKARWASWNAMNMDSAIAASNAALGGSNSPLDHFEPKEWDNVFAVNVTAQWHVLRAMHALLLKSDAGRVIFMSSGSAVNARAYRGLYSATKGALEVIARTYAAETATTPIKSTIVTPGPTRTRMRAAVAPGEDPMTLPAAEDLAPLIAELLSPECTLNGELVKFR